MYRNEVVDLLNRLDKKRLKLFPQDTDFPKTVDQWGSLLSKYTKAELDELLENGFYIRCTNPSAVLQDLVRSLEEQRFDKSPKGIAYKEKHIADYYARHPHTAEPPKAEPMTYDAYYWAILIDDEWQMVDDSTLPFRREKPLCLNTGRI